MCTNLSILLYLLVHILNNRITIVIIMRLSLQLWLWPSTRGFILASTPHLFLAVSSDQQQPDSPYLCLCLFVCSSVIYAWLWTGETLTHARNKFSNVCEQFLSSLVLQWPVQTLFSSVLRPSPTLAYRVSAFVEWLSHLWHSRVFLTLFWNFRNREESDSSLFLLFLGLDSLPCPLQIHLHSPAPQHSNFLETLNHHQGKSGS